MQYKIIPANEVQTGDVIFTNIGEGADVQFCGRIIGETLPRPKSGLTEWRVEVVVGTEETPTGSFTSISFQHNTLVGIAREDKYVDVDVASILADLDES